ncbi:MAG: hypothetical protein AAB544_05485 [Patescibacteria group bacterium]
MTNPVANFGSFLETRLRADFINHEIDMTNDDGTTQLRITNNNEYRSLSSNGATSEICGPYGRTTVVLEIRGEVTKLLESSGTEDHESAAIYFEGYIERQRSLFNNAA